VYDTVIRASRATCIREVAALDEQLFGTAEARVLVEVGLDAAAEVTDRYGTPDAPRWASGEVESEVFIVKSLNYRLE
jgi:hypothetical protein